MITWLLKHTAVVAELHPLPIKSSLVLVYHTPRDKKKPYYTSARRLSSYPLIHTEKRKPSAEGHVKDRAAAPQYLAASCSLGVRLL